MLKKENLLLTIFIVFIVSIIINLIGIANLKSNKSEKKETFDFLSSYKTVKPNSIAVINIFSPIYYADNENSYLNFKLERSGVLYWIDLLKTIESNKNIKALILRINSPGGTVAATQELYNAILRFKENTKIPVVVSMGDIATSGAYYISCAADVIVANPSTITASIGVIMEGFNFEEIMKKFGISVNTIKSGKNKDIMSAFRKMTDEENQILKNLIMDAYNEFYTVVKERRNLTDEKMKTVADGRIYSGVSAKRENLIDELGDFDVAVKIAAEKASISNYTLYYPETEENKLLKLILSSFNKNNLNPLNQLTKINNNYSPLLYMIDF